MGQWERTLAGCLFAILFACLLWRFTLPPAAAGVPLDTVDADEKPGTSTVPLTEDEGAIAPLYLTYNRRWALPPPLSMFPMPQVAKNVAEDTGC